MRDFSYFLYFQTQLPSVSLTQKHRTKFKLQRNLLEDAWRYIWHKDTETLSSFLAALN